MKRFLFGGSCLGMTVLCILSMFVILLVGSVLFTQSQANLSFLDATSTQIRLIPSATQPVRPMSTATSGPEIGVTIEMSAQPTTTATQNMPSISTEDGLTVKSTDAPFMTATPGNAPLGADVYELTVTAQIVINRTKGADERQKLWATRTAVADESRRIFATLTTEAQLSATPTGQ